MAFVFVHTCHCHSVVFLTMAFLGPSPHKSLFHPCHWHFPKNLPFCQNCLLIVKCFLQLEQQIKPSPKLLSHIPFEHWADMSLTQKISIQWAISKMLFMPEGCWSKPHRELWEVTWHQTSPKFPMRFWPTAISMGKTWHKGWLQNTQGERYRNFLGFFGLHRKKIEW